MPPLSWRGSLCSKPSSRTMCSSCMARSRACFAGMPSTSAGSMTFSRMVRQGSRMELWNTTPTSRRVP
ncbi:Uncharacterised protein [Mycobacterium tuberculosis]|nr:Uncharacterised protein [Mycobacterium tuberculosis]